MNSTRALNVAMCFLRFKIRIKNWQTKKFVLLKGCTLPILSIAFCREAPEGIEEPLKKDLQVEINAEAIKKQKSRF